MYKSYRIYDEFYINVMLGCGNTRSSCVLYVCLRVCSVINPADTRIQTLQFYVSLHRSIVGVVFIECVYVWACVLYDTLCIILLL